MNNTSHLNEMLRDGSARLCEAALYFAREIAYPDLDPETWLAQLDQIAVSLAAALPTEPRARACEIARYLAEDYGLSGNTDAYYDPRNSYLHEVITRRVGIPITLAMIYLHIAHRLGVDAYGVGLPGHFVVGVHLPDSDPLYIDLFHSGRLLTEGECYALARKPGDRAGGPGMDDLFKPMEVRTILLRMLNNLRAVYLSGSQIEMGIRVIQHQHLLDPDNRTYLRDLGILTFQLKRWHESRSHLDSYVSGALSAEDFLEARHYLYEALGEIARLN